ncbi:MAG: response regulator [Myxococcota bacterium]
MARVLIAEPSKTLAALVKLSLADLGAELEVVHDGASALASAKNRLPDALVADQALSGLDGYALAHGVKQLGAERRKTVPILLLVSDHAPPDAERLAYVGITDVLPKPFERAVLLERVRALLDLAPAASPSLPPTAPSPRPSAMPLASGLPPTQTPSQAAHELDLRPLVESQVEAMLAPVLAAKLPALLDAALQRMLPPLVATAAERALVEGGRVPSLVEAIVRRSLGEIATPTSIQRIVSDDAKLALGDAVGRAVQHIEGRLESELLERLDRFARDVLPARLQAHAEQVIWKIVPTLAEDIIKDEIKRLTQENP